MLLQWFISMVYFYRSAITIHQPLVGTGVLSFINTVLNFFDILQTMSTKTERITSDFKLIDVEQQLTEITATQKREKTSEGHGGHTVKS